MKKIGFVFVLILVSNCYASANLHFELVPDTNTSQVLPVRPLVTETDTTEGFWFVEQNASFQGGDLNAFSTWVATQIIYPAEASINKLQGKVFVQFSVNRFGKVCDLKVVREVHPLLDREVVRVIKMSPDWEPAMQGGKYVKQNFVIPVAFQLGRSGRK
jgi:periplasmic protein TonB